MRKTQCYICGKPLTGGTDTFGWPDDLCWDCYVEFQAGCEGESYYGLAPHHHDETITGSLIGSTVYDSLPESMPCGGYDLGYATLIPDPEMDGKAGIWTPKPLPGWR